MIHSKESLNLLKNRIMTTAAIRQKLHNYLEVADGKKVKAMYAMLEEDIEESSVEYSDELKNELDKRFEDLQNGKVKSISAAESKKRIEKIMKSSRKK